MNVPSEPTYYTTDFTNLKGANFSVDSSLVDAYHSPDLLNMISQEGAFPRKRKGWEILNSTETSEVDNIWTFKLYGRRRCVVSVGTKIIEYDLSTNTYVGTGITTTAGKKGAFFFQNASVKGLYILNGSSFILATAASDSANLAFAEPDYYAPLVIIARDPTNGGGTAYEAVNLMTRKRKERFIDSAGTATSFMCTSAISSLISLEYFNGTEWVTDTTATASGNKVTITTAHAYIGESGTGSDNIRITYSATGSTSIGKIAGCTSIGHYTQGVSDQVFTTANPNYPQYVFYCGLSDPSYWPDLSYLLVGSGGTQIMGFLNVSGYLAIVKESSGQDATIFLMSYTTVTDTDSSGNSTSRYEYKLEQGTTGIGAVSKWCFRNLNDEPLFFSTYGICGMVSTTLTSEKVTRNRSRFIDRKLLEEPNLDKAIAEVYNGYYILAVNSHAYVLDGRQKTSDSSGNTSYIYESYYWDNIPATAMTTFDKELYFGTADGRICRFKNRSIDDPYYIYDYSDASIGTYGSTGYVEGTAIDAVWSTPNYDDNAPQYVKTMSKRGSMITLQPYKKSGVDIYVSKDSANKQYIGHVNVDIWSGFDDIDFSRFAFDTREGVRDYFFGKKVKKYKRMKIIAENNVINEPFGVHEIIRTFTKDKFAKK